jgi:hypothetical protein
MSMIQNIITNNSNTNIIIQGILSTLHKPLLLSLQDLKYDISNIIMQIINFLEFKLQFHLIKKQITYVVNDEHIIKTKNIILPFWPIIEINQIINNLNEKIHKFQIQYNKIIILDMKSNHIPYKIQYTIGYNWQELQTSLPILIYIIEFYLRQYINFNEFKTTEEINNLILEIKNIYGKGEI